VQIFDTWAGILTPGDYEEYALPYTRQVVEGLNRKGVPVCMEIVPLPSPFPLGACHVTPRFWPLWLQATTASATRATSLSQDTTADHARFTGRRAIRLHPSRIVTISVARLSTPALSKMA